ncbi:MAG: HAD family hydrolase [Clostridia bacterium]|nr:HAD family hydrolase [Clostridia bacterium]
MNKFKAVIFDFDGTIVDSGEGIRRSIEYALEKNGVPVGEKSKLNYFIGPPLNVSFEDMYGINGEQCEKLIETYRDRYARLGVYEVELYEGIVELLNTLKENGIKIGIASSKPTCFIKQVMEYFKISEFFDTVVGTNFEKHNADKKELINTALKNLGITDKSVSIMVGDRLYDINGAKGAGILSVGVLYGYGSETELKDAGADFLAHDVTEIYKILNNNDETLKKQLTI